MINKHYIEELWSQSKHCDKNATSYTAIYDFQASSVLVSRVQLCVSWPQCTCSFKKKCVGGRGGVKTWIETLKTSTKRPRGSGEQNQVNVYPKVSILGGLHFQEDGVDIFPYSPTKFNCKSWTSSIKQTCNRMLRKEGHSLGRERETEGV